MDPTGYDILLSDDRLPSTIIKMKISKRRQMASTVWSVWQKLIDGDSLFHNKENIAILTVTLTTQGLSQYKHSISNCRKNKYHSQNLNQN